jgi:integrase
MPRHAKGPRLWLRPARRDAEGRITHVAGWFVLDGNSQSGTGLGAGATPDEKEKALSAYLVEKHSDVRQAGLKDPVNIPVDDVLTLYTLEKAKDHADPKKTDSRIGFLSAFWSGKMLSEVTGKTCRDYARQRGHDQAARRELEDLRAAINYHRKEGLHDRIVSVVLPDKAPSRERWLTRDEAAHLIRTTWRHRSKPAGQGATSRNWRHVARFMVVARYMGSRASVIAMASIEPKRPKAGPWIDLASGTFHGRGVGERVTNKRKQAVQVPAELLGHLRRWRANGQRYAVEWHGKPVQSCKGAHSEAVVAAGLDDKVTQHTWRHTVATWLLSEDVSIQKVADFLAVDAKTLLRVYAHAIPSRTAEVHAAFRAHRSRKRA